MNYEIKVVAGRLEVVDTYAGIIYIYDFKDNGVEMSAKNLCHWIKKFTKRVEKPKRRRIYDELICEELY